MDRFGYPALYAILLWWISTGVVLHIVNQARSTYVYSLGVATFLLLVGVLGLYSSSSDMSYTAVYLGFGSALLVWAWHEMSFLMGVVTGPRTCGASSRTAGRAPLAEAIASMIYHEFAIAITALVIWMTLSGANNQTGLWTFMILWLSRLSAKLNVYFGVPNLTEDFLPKHLEYIKTYFCRRPMNMLFPLSVTATTIAVFSEIQIALDPTTGDSEAAAAIMLTTLLALALIEHWFLVLPFDSGRLWSWAKHDTGANTAIDLPKTVTQASASGGDS